MTPPKRPRGNMGLGRPKGAKNKATAQLKEMILTALDANGGAAYLSQQARDNPTAFLTLLGKVLPMTLAGDPEKPLKLISRVELIALK